MILYGDCGTVKVKKKDANSGLLGCVNLSTALTLNFGTGSKLCVADTPSILEL